MRPDLIVLHEHPEWQKPLFSALEKRGIAFEPFDVTRAAFSNVDAPRAPLYFNQASPSAYLRGNTRAVPLALAYMRTLEQSGAPFIFVWFPPVKKQRVIGDSPVTPLCFCSP